MCICCNCYFIRYIYIYILLYIICHIVYSIIIYISDVNDAELFDADITLIVINAETFIFGKNEPNRDSIELAIAK